MSFGSRLKERRESLGITQPQLADMLEVSKGAIGNYETDSNSPKATILYKMFDVLKCDANFLFQDEMDNSVYKNVSTSEEFEKIIKKYRHLDTQGQSHVDAVLQWETDRIEQLKQASAPAAIIEFSPRSDGETRLIEYFRSASAGTGVFILGNEATEQIEIPDTPENKNADFVIKVSGDSMSPDYEDGDMVLVSQKAELLHGDVGIFIINNTAYIKEYGVEELISRNPDSDNIQIAEYDNIVCMGKVIGKL